MTTPPATTSPRQSDTSTRYFLMLLMGGSIAAVFIADLLLPLGVAAGIVYVLPVLASIRATDSRLTIAVAALCCLLTVVGYYESAPSGTHWMAVANRAMSVGVICASAALLVFRAHTLTTLKATHDRLQAVLDTAPDGIIVIDSQGIVESINRSAQRLFGYRSDEVVGRNVSCLMPPEEAESHDGYIGRFLETGERRIIGIGREVTGKAKDGTLIPMRLAVGEMDGEERRFTGVLHDLSEFRRMEKDSLEDAVTGLLNRRGFDRTLAAALSRDATSLLFVDVDRLKRINDELGHASGDQAITSAADHIRSSLRVIERGAAARFGGDEFAVILPGVDLEVAMKVAQRISQSAQSALATIHPASGVSIGVAAAPMGSDPDALMRRTDEALYRAKQQRGCVSQ